MGFTSCPFISFAKFSLDQDNAHEHGHHFVPISHVYDFAIVSRPPKSRIQMIKTLRSAIINRIIIFFLILVLRIALASDGGESKAHLLLGFRSIARRFEERRERRHHIGAVFPAKGAFINRVVIVASFVGKLEA